MSGWLVRYRLTTQGTAYVEADSASQAIAQVVHGDFEEDPGAEWVDFEPIGDPREDR